MRFRGKRRSRAGYSGQGGPEQVLMSDKKKHHVAAKFGADAYYELTAHEDNQFGVDKSVVPGNSYEMDVARNSTVSIAQMNSLIGNQKLYSLMSIFKEYRILRVEHVFSSPSLVKKTISGGVTTAASTIAGTVDIQLVPYVGPIRYNSDVFSSLNAIETIPGSRDKRMNLSATGYPSQGQFLKVQTHWPRVKMLSDGQGHIPGVPGNPGIPGTITAFPGPTKSVWMSCGITDTIYTLYLERWHNMFVTDRYVFPSSGEKLDLAFAVDAKFCILFRGTNIKVLKNSLVDKIKELEGTFILFGKNDVQSGLSPLLRYVSEGVESCTIKDCFGQYDVGKFPYHEILNGLSIGDGPTPVA